MHKVLKTIPKGNRTQVFVDDNNSFLLYKGEMRKYNIEPEMELEDETYREILELLYKRAKERALYLLDDSYKTEKQIRDKLRGGCYPESIINNVIIYLTEYGLVDDLRYAKLYIEYKSSSKSKKQIVQDLYVKGIQKKKIDEAFEESEYSDEKSLNKIVEKRISRYNLNEPKDVQKLYRYLVAKGYSYSDVRKTIERYSDESYYD